MKIGDYVRFINERQEGVITKIIDHQLIGVSIEGDFEIPVLRSEVVLVSSVEANLREEFNELPNASIAGNTLEDAKMYVAIVPDVKISQLYHVHLVNTLAHSITVAWFTERSGAFEGLYTGVIAPMHAQRVASLNLSLLEQIQVHHLQVLHFQDGSFAPYPPEVYRKSIKPKHILTQQKDIPILNVQGYCAEWDSAAMQVNAEDLQAHFSAGAKKSKEPVISVPESEIDLHIEELREDFSTMTPEAILRYQLEVFRNKLDLAVVHNFSSIIFIHGVGQGVLRQEIHRALGKHPHVRTFKDARKDKFGYGATEVILK